VTRFLALIAALAAVAAAATVTAPPAAAASPCWKRLVDDWVKDTVIDKAYPARCYREALRHLPADLSDYTSVREDIQRALQAAIRANNGQEPTVVEAPATSHKHEALRGLTAAAAAASSGGDDNNDSGSGGVLDRILPRANGTSSVPLPLLVLAGLALLLLAAAAVSFGARQVQARRLRTPPSGGEPPTA
jgi:hypothetical protein